MIKKAKIVFGISDFLFCFPEGSIFFSPPFLADTLVEALIIFHIPC